MASRLQSLLFLTIAVLAWAKTTEELQSDRIDPDDTPQLQLLRNFKRKNGKGPRVDIIAKTATDYKHFGILLLLDDSGTTVNTIERAKGPDPVDIVNEIFSRWLAGKGRVPVSWTTLVECLRDVHLNVVANMIVDMYDKQTEESTVSDSLAHRSRDRGEF